ncbi:TetR/AcrR family transcriptional regulator [Roseobacter weihaiensis]|uniref:TetR/AcrR family transcriptional regulator n=1 Tax=Roseobacter weihaiensis TaxID=2763262 RepID=UPI001D0A62B7|nr:TetR/AcrR family transcriptional regulator [Roseobacter sp. H9]
MVEKKSEPRKRGRPRSFDTNAALDAAVGVFWREGYDGADTASLAAAMGLTKPSVYAAFGDKRSLFMHALQRYGATTGAEAIQAFVAAEDATSAIAAFFAALVTTQSGKRGGQGCLLACVAAQCAETMPEVKTLLADSLVAGQAHIADRLEQAVRTGELPDDYPVHRRARLMIDLMQASAIRARSGATADMLASLARENADMVLAR